MRGSTQLHRYLGARRAGLSIEAACIAADPENPDGRPTIVEARLHDEADAAGEYSDIITTDPETAGCAATTTKEIFMPEDNDANPIAEMAAETLRGDVRDAMLSWFKATPKPWSQMGEREQRDFADAADRAARDFVKQACQIIASNERPCIVATLTEYREKDGIEAKLKLASKGEIVAALHDACGREVLVVTSGFEEFNGEAAPAVIDADQGDLLGVGEEYEEAA